MSAPFEIPLSYRPDMIAFYASLSSLPGFILLESMDKQYGRYDILTAMPYDVQKNQTSPQIARGSRNQIPRSLPFQGGVIGILSYEYGAYLRNIPAGRSIPPPWLNYFQYYDWAIIVDHWQRKTTLYAHNARHDTSAIVKDVLRLWRQEESTVFDIAILHLHSLVSAEHYKINIDTIQKALREGRCYQVNYSQPYTIEVSNHDPWELYCQIRKNNPVPYAAFLRLDDRAIMCFSPERFLRCDPEGNALTSPIKGSASRHANPSLDRSLAQKLLHCPKNRAENIMIVDLLRNDLSRICQAGSVQVQGLLELQSFPSVHHLVSHIYGKLKSELTPLEALLSCLPGGSITGAPKIEAMKMIAELESVSRGMYCGSIAYFSTHGAMDSNIAIRTLESDGQSFRLSAGGGIVLDSLWEDEYAECTTKMMGILKALDARYSE